MIFVFFFFAFQPLTAAAGGTLPFVYRKSYSMGTVYEIVAYAPSRDRAWRAAGAALQEVASLDRMMSNYDPQSDLSRLNRNAHFRAVPVPADLFRLIGDSLIYSKASSGKYDVTVGPLVDAWKRAIRNGTPPTPEEIGGLRLCTGYRKVQLIAPNRIEFHSPCLSIDLGSIAKGYAVDRAAKILRSFGVRAALINAGGSTFYGIGSPPGRPGWMVQLRDPSGTIKPEVLLHNNSISTSEQRETSIIDSGEFGHIINPANGEPLRTDFAVSAVAPTATASDGLSTTLFLMGPHDGSRLVRTLRGTAAIWVSKAGQVVTASTGPEFVLRRNQ
ncbi:MAG: FAD:protein FMN transferase [Acidobacteriota bacterium]|nr:FAD:protein FMN transferase [Acidobacteriota bacterium]